MHAVVRNYSGKGAKEMIALMEQRKAELDGIFHAIPGFVSYAAVKTDTGSFTVTICESRKGTDESVTIAREWLAKNCGSLGLNPPTITEGSVALHMK
jgi:hypothetical protein